MDNETIVNRDYEKMATVYLDAQPNEDDMYDEYVQSIVNMLEYNDYENSLNWTLEQRKAKLVKILDFVDEIIRT